MMRRMMSARIDDVAVPSAGDPVGREPLAERRERIDALVAADGPAALEEHDELRWMRVKAREEFRAEALDRARLGVVIEVKVVDEPRGLDGAQAQQRVDPALGRVEHLHEIPRRDPP